MPYPKTKTMTALFEHERHVWQAGKAVSAPCFLTALLMQMELGGGGRAQRLKGAYTGVHQGGGRTTV